MKKKNSRNFWIVSGVVLLGAAYALSEFIDGKNEETPIVVTTLPEIEGSYANGQLLYQSNCMSCHGEALGGKKGLGPPFVHGYYKPGHHADIAFYRAIKLGVTAHHWQFGNMPPVPSLSEADAAEIIKYIRFVQRSNGIS